MSVSEMSIDMMGIGIDKDEYEDITTTMLDITATVFDIIATMFEHHGYCVYTS